MKKSNVKSILDSEKESDDRVPSILSTIWSTMSANLNFCPSKKIAYIDDFLFASLHVLRSGNVKTLQRSKNELIVFLSVLFVEIKSTIL